jgi:16S rRNA processing protein RimM
MVAELPSEAHSTRQPPEYLAVGVVLKPHGVRGGLRVQALSHLYHSLKPGTTVYLGPQRVPLKVKTTQPHRKANLVYLYGCESREQAESWRDVEVCLRFDEVEVLPEGVYYYWQILGIETFTNAGELLGEVVDIIETGANDVYVIRSEGKPDLLVPAIPSVVLDVDLEGGRMTVDLPEGLAPDSAEG